MLQRIRVLAVQSANGTNTKEDREALQQEVNQLSQEIDRIAKQTTFAGALILNGKFDKANNKNSLIPDTGNMVFQVGANKGDTISLVWDKPFTMTGIASIANNAVLTFQDDKTKASKSGLLLTKDGFARWSISSVGAATATLGNIDKFIQAVDSKRAELGAIQNRMESSIRNQANVSENQSDARSRIRDTDFAAETAALTQNNIIQQSSQAILAQANQRPTIALSLLGQ